jgi:ribonucleoside-diphosphate reductase alpha chain
MKDLYQDQLHLHGIDPLQGHKLFVRKRDGRIEEFNEARISIAIESAFKAIEGIGRDALLPRELQTAVKKSADAVVDRVLGRAVRGEELEVERIQDTVEEQLMLDGHLAVARCYILYREQRRQARAERENRSVPPMKITPTRKSPPPPGEVPVPFHKPEHEFLHTLYHEALPKSPTGGQFEGAHRQQFPAFVNDAQYLDHVAPEMLDFDLEKLAGALRLEQDELFPLAGLRALNDDFLLQEGGRRIETPQYFWMRVAMGLALNEGDEDRDAHAMEFYDALSSFRFVPSETILSHAGAIDPRLMTCFASTGWNDLEHVVAQPSPRLAHRQKKGQTCSWLEPWHSGILDFLARPAPGRDPWEHDLNKGLWIPDLFMKRVRENAQWTLFEPAQVPELHQQFGRRFEENYVKYEEKAVRGEIPGSRRISAMELWQEILASLAQTGQPWLGFKDTVNQRSPQENGGVIHGGSLCTSILLNTSANETSACAVGSVNLAAHLTGDPAAPLDVALLRRTVAGAMRMLDNAIELSGHPSEAARTTGREYRPVALGILGFQDALDSAKLDYGSAAAAEFADRSMELISACALFASADLARERGAFPAYPGSKWSHGHFPPDTLASLSKERGLAIDTDLSMTEDWDRVRNAARRHGLRHCTHTAISTTDLASKITGASPSVEPRAPFAIEPQWLIECAARRQKWIDMGQSLSLYTTTTDPAALGEMLMQAWEKGLKTTRQLRFGSKPALPMNQEESATAPAISEPEAAFVK